MTLSAASGGVGDGGTGVPVERDGIGEITAADAVEGFGVVGIGPGEPTGSVVDPHPTATSRTISVAMIARTDGAYASVPVSRPPGIEKAGALAPALEVRWGSLSCSRSSSRS